MYRDFIPYEQALALKDLEFDEPCLSAYRNTDGEQLLMGFSMWKNFTIHDNHDGFAAAPLYQQAFRWFREKHKLFSKIELEDVELNLFSYEILQDKKGKYNNELYIDMDFKTYEEAELACLIKLIEIQKELNVK